MVFQSIIKHVKKDTRHNLAIFYIVCFLSAFPVTELLGQYPDTIYMSHSMIGHATIVARKSVIHQPGFKVKPGLYFHALIDPNFSGTGTTIDPPPDSLPITTNVSDRNYIITTTPQIQKFNPSSAHTCYDATVEIMYFDGLGREHQNVQVMASPGQYDMITPFTYDDFGRKDRDYLQYSSPENRDGHFDEGWPENQRQFISNMYGSNNATYGFAQTVFEPSPLNRNIKQSAPGEAWKINPGSPSEEYVKKLDYQVNDDEIQLWTCRADNIEQVQYSPGTLFINSARNENNGLNLSVTKEYKDKSGKFLMSESVNAGTAIRTIYIYDEFDLLRCVISPEGQSPADSGLCYYYRYDNRRRMTQKKLPGTGWQYMIYDKFDRMVMSQDERMRNEDGKRWLMYSYDSLSHLVMTGFYEHSGKTEIQEMQDKYNALDSIHEYINGNYNETNHGYSHKVADGLGGTYDVLLVNYYDNYGFIPQSPPDYSFDEANGIVSSGIVLTGRLKDLKTGTKVRVLNGDYTMKEWLLTSIHYDSNFRVIQTVGDNLYPDSDPLKTGIDIMTTKYSFTGRILSQRVKHTAFDTTILLTENFTYDPAGRLLDHTMSGMHDQPDIMLASMRYNEAGQLLKKQVHSESSGGSWLPFIQKTDFSYNIRGWLSQINNPANIGADKDIFAQKLYYQDEVTGATAEPQYNGNISAIEWITNQSPNRYLYSYSYDSLDRLTAGEFYRGTGGNWVHDGSFDEKNLAYDKNGNILSLYRFADSNMFIDEMRYHYLAGTNQIGYITDRQGDIPDVVDYPGNTKEDQTYFYDGNGNLIHDYDKNLYDTIRYNFLNKPEKFDFGNGEKIFYIYDATGLKVARKVVDNNETGETSLRYFGNFVYNWNGDLQYILTSEGRLVPDGGGFRFEYFMKDHLGNTRATYASAAPGVTQVAEYNHYYPFGMELEGVSYSSAADLANDYLYNGKELQRDHNLQWYDYGWREYDPQIGYFTRQDRFAEKYLNFSPYQYAANNPINKVDVNGDSIWFTYQYNEDKELTGVTMHVSGKVINVSDNDVDMDEATNDITEILQSSFQGDFDGISFTTEAHLSVAKNMDDVKKSDHVFALAEISNGGIEDVTVMGAANQFGGKVAFIDADYFTGLWDKYIGNTGERTSGHEFGHLANLRHSGDFFNIMRQSAGNSFFSMSTNLRSKQLKSIYNSYIYGLLNKGSNFEYIPVFDYTQGRWTYKKMPNRGKVTPFVKY